jgi:ankyrin repeat protein
MTYLISVRFLIAQLSLELLKTEISIRDLEATLFQFLERSKLNDLDQFLCKVYDETMERIFEQHRRHVDLARKVLSWVAFAVKGLTVIEVQHALALREGDAELNVKGISNAGLIVSVCCGLVTVDEGSGIIQLVHYTTDEYFKANETLLFPDVHLYLMKQCLSYLLLQNFDDLLVSFVGFDWFKELCARLAPYPFYDYCANYWGLHGRKMSERAQSEETEIALRFLNGGPKLDAAVRVMRYDGRIRGVSMNGLHLAARFGLHFLMDALLAKHDIKSPDGLGQTALGWACIGGHMAIVEFLLLRLMALEDSGIDGQDRFYQETPLHLAACGGHSAIIEVLLKHGARPDVKDQLGNTPLVAGIYCNHSDALVPLLHTIGNLKQQVAYAEGQSLLPLAIYVGNFEFVRILLDKGVDVNRRDVDGDTGLLQAVKQLDNLAAVKLFVDNGANLDSQDTEGRTALMAAVRKWSEDLVCLLLKHRVNQDLQDKEGQTALMIAVWRDSKNIVWFPLKHAADLSLKNDCGESTLFKECRSIQRSELPNNIIKILLEAGADINVEDNLGRTALTIAIENENYVAAGLLIERGANVDSQDDGGQTLLMKAIKADNQITSRLFIEGSRNLNLQDGDRKTALDYAFEKWLDLNGDHGEAIRKLLLEKGAKANLYPEAMDVSFEYPSLIPW